MIFVEVAPSYVVPTKKEPTRCRVGSGFFFFKEVW